MGGGTGTPIVGGGPFRDGEDELNHLDATVHGLTEALERIGERAKAVFEAAQLDAQDEANGIEIDRINSLSSDYYAIIVGEIGRIVNEMIPGTVPTDPTIVYDFVQLRT
jgi:hypothetical protein